MSASRAVEVPSGYDLMKYVLRNTFALHSDSGKNFPFFIFQYNQTFYLIRYTILSISRSDVLHGSLP
jgi:hypothetical protein